MRTIPCNPNAQPEVKEVLEYLSQIEGKGILTGQHTQTMEQPEIWRIEKLTGKLPAICGFELLSYSPNIRREAADEECLKEVDENTGTLEKAWKWAERGVLSTKPRANGSGGERRARKLRQNCSALCSVIIHSITIWIT